MISLHWINSNQIEKFNVNTVGKQIKIEYDNVVKNQADADKNIEAKIEFLKESEPKVEELGKNLDAIEAKHIQINIPKFRPQTGHQPD